MPYQMHYHTWATSFGLTWLVYFAFVKPFTINIKLFKFPDITKGLKPAPETKIKPWSWTMK